MLIFSLSEFKGQHKKKTDNVSSINFIVRPNIYE